MQQNAELFRAYALWYGAKTPVAMTLTYNCKTDGRASHKDFERRLKAFLNKIERVRGGCRFRKKARRSYAYALAPEKFSSGNPHYHGLFELPPDLVQRFGREETISLLGRLWKKTVPSGTSCIKELHDAEGWVRYSSKECALWSDDAYYSFPSQD